MTSQDKEQQGFAALCRAGALILGGGALALSIGCAAPPDDARWYGSVVVTQPAGAAGRVGEDLSYGSSGVPVLPGMAASGAAAGGARFWESRRDAELSSASGGAPLASTEWPTQPRPNEQIYRYKTILRQ